MLRRVSESKAQRTQRFAPSHQQEANRRASELEAEHVQHLAASRASQSDA